MKNFKQAIEYFTDLVLDRSEKVEWDNVLIERSVFPEKREGQKISAGCNDSDRKRFFTNYNTDLMSKINEHNSLNR